MPHTAPEGGQENGLVAQGVEHLDPGGIHGGIGAVIDAPEGCQTGGIHLVLGGVQHGEAVAHGFAVGDEGGLHILVGHTRDGHDIYIGQFGKGGQTGALAGNGVVSLVQAGGRIGQGAVGAAGQLDGQTVTRSAQAGQGTALFAFLLGLLY